MKRKLHKQTVKLYADRMYVRRVSYDSTELLSCAEVFEVYKEAKEIPTSSTRGKPDTEN